MAEKLKEFANVLLTTTDFVDNEYTIFANDATTQAVIKDVNVGLKAPALNSGVSVMNGASKIASGGNSTGFEFVAENQSLKIKLDPPMNGGTSVVYRFPILTEPLNTTYRLADWTVLDGASHPIKGVTAGVVVSDENTVPAMQSPRWFYVNKAGTYAYYFNYDGNSTTTLYYASVSGGTIGGWNTWKSSNYRYCALDVKDERVFIHNTSGNVEILQLSSPAQTSVSAFNQGTSASTQTPSTYAHSSFVNGVFFSQPSSSYSDRVIYWDQSANESATIYGNFYAASNGCLAVSYNPEEKRWYILTNGTSNTKLNYVSGETLSGNYTLTTGNVDNPISIDSAANFIGSTDTGLFNWIHNDIIKVGKAENGGITVLDVDVVHEAYDNCNAGMGIYSNTTLTEADLDLEINVKVSGVEITGV
jgi:hypothetical protein